MARHNAGLYTFSPISSPKFLKTLPLEFFSAIYGVEDRIEFIVGDYFEIIQTLRPDVVFLSPPWGGPEYLDQETFDLANMSGLDGIKIFNDAAKLTKNIAYFVPRNTDGASLAKLAGEGGRKSIQKTIIFFQKYFHGR